MNISSTAPSSSLAAADNQRDYRITWLATFLFFVAFYGLIVPLPRYLTGIGLSDAEIGLVLGATAIASLVTRPIAGILTDRLGYRRMLLFGSLSLIVGAVGVVFTTQLWLLFGLRILQALGYVIFTTAGNALVGQLAAPEERSTKIAYFGLAANFAISMTPGLTDTLLGWIGLNTAFWLVGTIAAMTGILSRLLRFAPPAMTGPAQPVGLTQFWRFPRALWVSMFVSALFGVGFGAYFQFFAILLERRNIAAAPVFAAYGISIIVTRLLLGRYLDRIGLARVLIAAAVTMSIGLLMAAVGYSLPMLILAAALIAAGGGFFHPMLIAHHVMLLPARPGWAVACFYFGFDAGIGIGAWVLGAVLDLSGLTALYVAATLLTLATIVFVPALVRQQSMVNGEW
ncbi:MAG: MFS transporter [Caldilineaceae bacterium]